MEVPCSKIITFRDSDRRVFLSKHGALLSTDSFSDCTAYLSMKPASVPRTRGLCLLAGNQEGKVKKLIVFPSQWPQNSIKKQNCSFKNFDLFLILDSQKKFIYGDCELLSSCSSGFQNKHTY